MAVPTPEKQPDNGTDVVVSLECAGGAQGRYWVYLFLDIAELGLAARGHPCHRSRANRYPTPRTVRKCLGFAGSPSSFCLNRLTKLSRVRSVPS